MTEEKPEIGEDEMMDKQGKGSFGNLLKKSRKNPWMPASVVLAILVVALLIVSFSSTSSISENEAGEKFLDFANSRGANANLVSVEDLGSVYKVVLLIEDQEAPFYVTKDGNNYIPPGSLISMTGAVVDNSGAGSEATEIPQTERPEVELFIMTHCPYGTQSEKGFIPAINELSDSIDAEVRFVHYFMHAPEETETPREICIREEQADKWLDYLTCFLEDGDSARCVTEVGVDESAMQECISSGRSDEYYASDSELSEGYGVGGSPTLIINGQKVSSGRSPSVMLETICSAFTDSARPAACDLELSTVSPSPGFGWDGSGTDSGAQC